MEKSDMIKLKNIYEIELKKHRLFGNDKALDIYRLKLTAILIELNKKA